MMGLIKYSFWLFILVQLSCVEPPKPKTPEATGPYENGFFVISEGGFQRENGEVSFFSADSNKMFRGIFKNANGEGLGDVVQSIYFNDTHGFIVVNNSAKVEVVDKKTFLRVATIMGFSSPRFFTEANGFGYVTDWVSNTVKIIDLNTFKISGEIEVGKGPETMVEIDGKLIVANNGGFENDSTLSIIDLSTNQLEKTLWVADAPETMHQMSDGLLYVLCRGRLHYPPESIESLAHLVAVNTNNWIVQKKIQIGEIGLHPIRLTSDEIGENLFFTSETGIYKHFIHDTDPLSFKVNSRFHYGIAIDNQRNHLLGAGKNYNNFIYRYNLSNFEPIDSMQVGEFSNGFKTN
ncbi:MAG: YVTN family beta-propeller protein [Sphingobacteriales bacterium]|jgi:YVTN family beta-propeller protein